MASALTAAALLAPKTKQVAIDGGYVTLRALTAAYGLSLRGKTLGDAEIFDMISRSLAEPELAPDQVAQLPLSTIKTIVDSVMSFNALSEGAPAAIADDLKKTPADGLSSN